MGDRCQCGQYLQRPFGEHVSTSHAKDGDEEMIQPNADPRIKHITALWDIHFKLRDHPPRIG